MNITHVIFSNESAPANAFKAEQVEGLQAIEEAANVNNKTYKNKYEYDESDGRYYYRGCSIVGKHKIKELDENE